MYKRNYNKLIFRIFVSNNKLTKVKEKIRELGLIDYHVKDKDFSEDNIIEHTYGTYFIEPYRVCSSIFRVYANMDLFAINRAAYRTTQKLIFLNSNDDIEEVANKAKEYIFYVIQSNRSVLPPEMFYSNGYFIFSNAVTSSIVSAMNDAIDGLFINSIYDDKRVLLKENGLNQTERIKRINTIIGYAHKKLRFDEIFAIVCTIIEESCEFISPEVVKKYLHTSISDKTIRTYLKSMSSIIDKYNSDVFGVNNKNDYLSLQNLNKIASGASAIHKREELITKMKIHKETEVSRVTIDKHYYKISDDVEVMNNKLKGL